jgi:hypothetical protein
LGIWLDYFFYKNYKACWSLPHVEDGFWQGSGADGNPIRYLMFMPDMGNKKATCPWEEAAFSG